MSREDVEGAPFIKQPGKNPSEFRNAYGVCAEKVMSFLQSIESNVLEEDLINRIRVYRAARDELMEQMIASGELNFPYNALPEMVWKKLMEDCEIIGALGSNDLKEDEEG